MSQPHDFPFDITDVAELLHLRIRRPSPQGLYVDCPICNDKRGKMHINTQSDTWRCNYCDESGGMLALYAKVHSISTSTAYREISDALLNGVNLSDHAVKFPDKPKETPVEAAPAADIAVRNKTYTALLAMLTLSKEHRAHLQTVEACRTNRSRGWATRPCLPFICAVHWQTGFSKTGISWMACRDFIKRTVSGRLPVPALLPAL